MGRRRRTRNGGGPRGMSRPRRRRRLPITREPAADGFVYRQDGRRITRKSEIARIDALAIPPAWTDVEIARSPSAKVLARGVDAAGRTQAIYHPAFRRRRDREKFDRVVRFAERLPRLRARVDRDLRRRTLSRDRVVACVIRLIDQGYFRVGNAEYARRNRSYGVTTLRRRHVRATASAVTFDFVGKSGKRHLRRVRDPRVARLVQRLEEMPGQELFRFFDEDGIVRNIESRHVNAYVKRFAGEEFTAKDFRTWGGTLLAASALLALEPEELSTPRKAAAATRAVVKDVAERLGNTPAVTRSSYIDPRVLDAAEDPELLARVREAGRRMRPRPYFSTEEQSALALIMARSSSRA